MGALLESKIRAEVAKAFKGKLLTCTLRRAVAGGVDEYGDPVPGSVSTWPFEGFVDTFDAVFAVQAGIKQTNVKVVIIAGTLDTTPTQDDQVYVRDTWYQLDDLVARDPARASYEFSAFQIAAPS